MKIFHTICAAVMAATISSCDAHQDFPDTSMKIGDILCTDGKVVRYEEMVLPQFCWMAFQQHKIEHIEFFF